MSLRGCPVLVLGAAYKKDVSDMRESPAIDIIHLLQEKGAQVIYHDPHVPSFHYEGIAMACVVDLDAALMRADYVVVATDHSAYDWPAISRQSRLGVDTRRAVRPAAL